jgi:hypothetical protein
VLRFHCHKRIAIQIRTPLLCYTPLSLTLAVVTL